MKHFILISLALLVLSCGNQKQEPQAVTIDPHPVQQVASQPPAQQPAQPPAQQAPQQEPSQKKLIASGTAQEWQIIINIMERSTAPYTDVKAATLFLANQLNPQLDTTKTK